MPSEPQLPDEADSRAIVNAEIMNWAVGELGGLTALEPVRHEMSEVFLAHCADGRSVILKVRHDPSGRAVACVEVQRHVHAAGLPVPAPLTAVGRFGQLSVHAEEWRDGGELLIGDNVGNAARSACLLAEVIRALGSYRPTHLPLPNPDWVRWDYSGPGQWPPHIWIDAAPNQGPLPHLLEDAAGRVRQRMRETDLPLVVGHGDWETQNLRWSNEKAFVIHDWDSSVLLPEAAIAGAACGAFASNETPTLASLASSLAFLDAYQSGRGRRFTDEEVQVAWAASLWPAIHNARAEFRFDLNRVAGDALKNQASARLRLARA